ncbi:MAG: hypothetical protein LBR10_13265 [Prevotellaceae bacterium]|nr:hypothetical protein [Prevotellaceae bacterium]
MYDKNKIPELLNIQEDDNPSFGVAERYAEAKSRLPACRPALQQGGCGY